MPFNLFCCCAIRPQQADEPASDPWLQPLHRRRLLDRLAPRASQGIRRASQTIRRRKSPKHATRAAIKAEVARVWPIVVATFERLGAGVERLRTRLDEEIARREAAEARLQ